MKDREPPSGPAAEQKRHDTSNIEGILESIEDAGEDPDRVSVLEMLREIGDDAFPPIMLAAALIMVSPASGIPGLSSFSAAIVALAAFQMVIGRKALWLPGFVTRRTVRRTTLEKAVHWLSRPAYYVDRLIGRRLTMLTHRPFSLFCAGACLAIALVVPMLELVPFSASIAGTAISFFALGLVAGDGLLVLIGSVIVSGAAGFGIYLLVQ